MVKLWKHQEKMIDFALDRIDNGKGFAWWLAGCSTGKTITAYELIKRVNAKRALVITKKSACSAWHRDRPADCDVLITTDAYDSPLNSTSKTKAVQIDEFLKEFSENNHKIVVVNYETAKLIPFTTGIMQRWMFDIVILDESQAIKSAKSQTTLALSQACANIPIKILMTGTGWDVVTDIYSQVRFFDCKKGRRYLYTDLTAPHDTWTSFFERHVNYITLDNHVKIPNKYNPYKRVGELMGTIAPFTLRIATEDVHDLPKTMHIKEDIRAHYSFENDYKNFAKDQILTLNGETMTASFATTLALRLRMFTSGIFTPDANPRERMYSKGSHKLNTLSDLLDSIGNEPIVIFTNFIDEIKLIKEELKKDVAVLDGSHNDLGLFQSGRRRIIICNVSAGAEGIDLSNCGGTSVKHVIYYSLPTSSIKFEQSQWRVRRVNNTQDTVVYHYLTVTGTIDEKVYDALMSKQDFNTALVREYLTSI